jgi:hypothetical protein
MPQVKHVVIFKFKPNTPEDHIRSAFMALRGLQKSIPGIKEFIGGPYKSPEGMNQGYTHGFIMTFESPKARDVYLPHPEHEKVKSSILPMLDSVIAFDFEVA